LSSLFRILALLASMPLLFPPGFCICKVELVDFFAQGQGKLDHSTSLPKCCQTCDRDDGQDATIETHSKSNRPVSDRSHLPGCPADDQAFLVKWIEPSSFLILDFHLDEVSSFEPRMRIELSRTNPRQHFILPQSRPMYLSHCALLI
jgi:hypothetical protein